MDNFSSQEYFEKLYQRAENWLSENGETLNSTLPLSINVLLQELSIHRVELEMQNEELRNVQSNIESSRDKYKTIFDHSPAGYLETDIQGRITLVNKTFCNLVHYEMSKIINLPFTFFISTRHRDRYYKFINKVIYTGGKHSLEIDLAGKSVSAAVIIQGVLLNEHGDKKCLLSVIELPGKSAKQQQQEYTSGKTPEEILRERELALKKALAELEQANKEFEEFSSIISHDLQEPVRIIESLCRLLVMRYKDNLDSRGEELVQIIIEGAVKIRDLVNELLNLSKVSTNRKQFEHFNAENVLDAVLSTLSRQIRESKATVTHDHLPRIFADRVQFEILLQNLISNAVKYHKEGEQPQVHVSFIDNENEWLFSVRDNGIGIDPRYHQRIFRIFQRLHLQTEYDGSGVGLTLCKKITDRHNGKIWVESEEGLGSTFFFTIPKT